MAQSGGGNRPGGESRSGSGNRQGSGNRRTGGSGPARGGSSAADRARERVGQQSGGGRPGRPARPGPARGGRRPANRGSSTAVRAGIFGGTFVVLAAVVIILVALLGGGGKAPKGVNDFVKPFSNPAVTSAIQHVPASAFAAAGDAASLGPVKAKSTGNAMVTLDGPQKSLNGKPFIQYLGAEYCPYCAATRWPLTIALSRFGSFSGLKLTASTPLDIYHSTHTVTFASARYSSPYIAFRGIEELTNECPSKDVVSNPNYSSTPSYYYPSKYMCNGNYLPLETPPASLQHLATTYDTDALFGTGNGGGIPFVYFGGKYAEDGALYDPGVLHGASWNQIVAALSVPNQGIGQQVLSVANRYTAIICNLTGQQPGSVCHTPVIQSAEKALR